jgi:hypothetical protein
VELEVEAARRVVLILRQLPQVNRLSAHLSFAPRMTRLLLRHLIPKRLLARLKLRLLKISLQRIPKPLWLAQAHRGY